MLKTGRRQIIYEPGKEMICQNCPHCNDCQEEIEISMPVRMGIEIIGSIGLVGSSREQKERILATFGDLCCEMEGCTIAQGPFQSEVSSRSVERRP